MLTQNVLGPPPILTIILRVSFTRPLRAARVASSLCLWANNFWRLVFNAGHSYRSRCEQPHSGRASSIRLTVMTLALALSGCFAIVIVLIIIAIIIVLLKIDIIFVLFLVLFCFIFLWFSSNCTVKLHAWIIFTRKKCLMFHCTSLGLSSRQLSWNKDQIRWLKKEKFDS